MQRLLATRVEFLRPCMVVLAHLERKLGKEGQQRAAVLGDAPPVSPVAVKHAEQAALLLRPKAVRLAEVAVLVLLKLGRAANVREARRLRSTEQMQSATCVVWDPS